MPKVENVYLKIGDIETFSCKHGKNGSQRPGLQGDIDEQTVLIVLMLLEFILNQVLQKCTENSLQGTPLVYKPQ